MTPDSADAQSGSPKTDDLEALVDEIGGDLRALEPGPLAELRRSTRLGGAPYFWRLASRHERIGRGDPEVWGAIVQAMAILTEKGRDPAKPSPHFEGRPLGQALCDGADRDWPHGARTPRPMLSEARLARLIAASGVQRRELLLRAVRMLAAGRPSGAGVNCADLARLLLFPEHPGPTEGLARTYYRRLDRAARASAAADQPTTTGDAG